MLYQYRGLNSEGQIVRGTIEAFDAKKARLMIKSSGEAEVLLDVTKASDIKPLNKYRDKYIHSLAESENKSRERSLIRELKKIEKLKKKLDPDQIKEGTTFFQKLSNFKLFSIKKKEKAGEIINLNKESLLKLQNIFTSANSKDESFAEVDFSERITEYEKTLELEEKVRNKLREKTGDKEINWDLIKDETVRPATKSSRKMKIKPAELFLFTRRLQIMITSGVSLLNALMILKKSSSPALSSITGQLIEMIQGGSSFSEALSKFPNQFNHIYVALVSVGESSGSMDRCLLDILAVQEQQMMIKKKIKSATVYPMVIGVVLIAVLIFGSVYFIPNFEGLFAEQGMELPMLTKVVFGIADKMPLLMGSLFAGIVGFIYAKKRIPSVDRFWKKSYHKLLLKAPVIRKVSNASYMFTFSSTVALMLNNGIRLKDTLALTYRAISNVYIKNAIISASGLMVRGESFSESLSKQPDFDDILVNIVETGEESGRMTFSLEQIARYYKEDLDRQINVLLELVQPVAILMVALLIGPVIIAVYLPILDMTSGGLGV